ncbi:hypothetical protein [Petrimonas mucosa]|uniref:hypothetical protein n=1 Tax=Petrimonas mucosa TaxID=1642646 RepID=UPI003C747727
MMKNEEKKLNIYKIMRVLHRDIGFLTIGLTLVYVLSGVLLIYRNTDFMKMEKTEEKQLAASLSGSEVAQQLRIRNFKVEREEGAVIYFKEGHYNGDTGMPVITRKVYIPPFDKLVNLHKVTGAHSLSVLSLIYGCMLFFLAFSSLFMFRFGSRKSKRGIVMIIISIVLTVVIVAFV